MPGVANPIRRALALAVGLVSAVAVDRVWRSQFDATVVALALAGFGIGVSRLRQEPGPAPAARERRRERAAGNLLDAFPDPALLIDARAVVLAANPTAARVLPGVAVGQPLSFALRAPEILDGVARVIRTGEADEVTYGGRGPADAVVNVRLRPVDRPSNVAGRGPAVALFFRDLSPERRVESMRIDFVANVSHELRTPLSSLSGFIDTLKGSARDDAVARDRFLDIMAAQAARMSRLIDDLLQLSRVELHAHVPPTGSVDLAEVAAHVLDALGPLAQDRGVRLSLDAEPGPFTVKGDRDELIRLVENLVENAIKYGGAGGIVTTTLGRSPPAGTGAPRIELGVRDDGPGIPPEHLPRLTERFYRVDRGESHRENGTGLGLAIVKGIVGRHRGRLAIESVVGTGTLARVTLPMRDGA